MMECNKEEAIRVRDIAELKFEKGDIEGAKKFILKALQLYPCLDGAIQLSAVLDVYIAAQVEVGINEPEPDYYGILQVKPLSDDCTIKQQYRILSKLVHPDKNKESMKEKSEAAFKMIANAFKVLSDKETRFQHDSKRGEKPTAKEPPKPTYSANQPRHQAATQPTPAPGAQASQAPSTFWTACPSCRMRYQYYRIYLDNQVVCQKCHSSFPANDVNVHPANGASAFVSPPANPAPGAQASQAPSTFWTACPLCRMRYQYDRIYLDNQLVCQKCHSSFPANDINVHPANGASAFVSPPASPAPDARASQAPSTFWTACPLCRMRYQYDRIYLDNQVVCQKCHSSFPANDVNVHPANGASAFAWPPGLWGTAIHS